jgi:hypothetical protein
MGVPGSSPAQSSEEDAVMLKSRQQQSILRIVLMIFALHMSSMMITIDSKMMIYLNAFKDTAKVATTNSRGMMAMLGSSCFLTPILAGYSQSNGRWPLFLIGGLSHLAMQLANLVAPVPKMVLFTTSFGAICNATMMASMIAVQDLFADDAKGAGAAMAFVQSGQVLAATVSPMLGAGLAIRSVRLPMFIGVILSSIEVALLRRLPETLDRTKMRKMCWSSIHPLSFLKLFRRGPRLGALAFVYLITEMTDPLVQMRTAGLAHLESLDWKMHEVGRYATLSSAISVPGYIKARQVEKALGAVPAFAMSGICLALHHLLEGLWVSKPWQQLALLPLLLPRGSTAASIKGLLVESGTAAGFHSGEMQGFISSLKYLAGFLGFPMWARFYTRALRVNRPRRFFLALSALVFVQMLTGQLAAAAPAAEKKIKKSEQHR